MGNLYIWGNLPRNIALFTMFRHSTLNRRFKNYIYVSVTEVKWSISLSLYIYAYGNETEPLMSIKN